MHRYAALWSCTVWFALNVHAQTIDRSYGNYDFIAGERTLFEDKFNYTEGERIEDHWEFMDGGGAASIKQMDDAPALSFDAFYTRLRPKPFKGAALPEEFSIEYDAWLDPAYDGPPGVSIVFRYENNEELSITPSKFNLIVNLPDNQSVAQDNPSEYHETSGRFLGRWVHFSIAVHGRRMTVYLDQHKMQDIADIQKRPKTVLVYGDAISDNNGGRSPMYMRNFRLADGFTKAIDLSNGKFVTRNIKFDVNKAVLKPESITVLKQVRDHLLANPALKLLVVGHTDSDGTDTANQALSEARAAAVVSELIALGVAKERLGSKGAGESEPLERATTPEAKANNRRVEFVVVP